MMEIQPTLLLSLLKMKFRTNGGCATRLSEAEICGRTILYVLNWFIRI